MDLLQQRVSVQRRVQLSALLHFAEQATADRATHAAVCPGAERRDLEVALQSLLDDASIEGPTWRMESLAALTRGGWLRLTARGRQRLDENDVTPRSLALRPGSQLAHSPGRRRSRQT
jgi:hypothetical protein